VEQGGETTCYAVILFWVGVGIGSLGLLNAIDSVAFEEDPRVSSDRPN